MLASVQVRVVLYTLTQVLGFATEQQVEANYPPSNSDRPTAADYTSVLTHKTLKPEGMHELGWAPLKLLTVVEDRGRLNSDSPRTSHGDPLEDSRCRTK